MNKSKKLLLFMINRYMVKCYRFITLLLLLVFATMLGCKKLVSIPNPISSVTAAQIFSSDVTATDALMGIYSNMSSSASFSNFLATTELGKSADELVNKAPGNELQDNFLSNTLTVLGNGYDALSEFWQPAYFNIYCTNELISGLQSSKSIDSSVSRELQGEAKFIRAFNYFYLVNLFGDVPQVVSPDFNQTSLLARAKVTDIYKMIESDLIDAQQMMNSDFSLSGGQPIRANKWAATALLARVYIYQKNWMEADSAASAIINAGLFYLESDLNKVFLPINTESILQLQSSVVKFPYTTFEGNFFNPKNNTSSVGTWLSSQLLNDFEPNDLRKVSWIDSTVFRGKVYYFPFKYKVRIGTNGVTSENYTILRLAEQYLIRAEAETMPGSQQDLNKAINDLNVIRNRAGLPNYSGSMSQDSIIIAVQHEKRIEFFAEWGHRWLDLKRWGIALQTLDTVSYKVGRINSTQLLYPIPLSEIQTDPNLTQNDGY